jgi:hypothetical protein
MCACESVARDAAIAAADVDSEPPRAWNEVKDLVAMKPVVAIVAGPYPRDLCPAATPTIS